MYGISSLIRTKTLCTQGKQLGPTQHNCILLQQWN